MDLNEKYLSGCAAYFLSNAIINGSHTCEPPDRDSLFLKIIGKEESKKFLALLKEFVPKNPKTKEEKKIMSIFPANSSDLKKLVSWIGLFRELNEKSEQFLYEEQLKVLKGMFKYQKINCDYKRRLNALSKMFKLNELERLIITYHILHGHIDGFVELGDDYYFQLRSISKVLNVKPVLIKNAMRKDGTLRKYLAIYKTAEVRLTEFVESYLNNLSNIKTTERFFSEYKDEFLDLEDFTIEDEVKNILSHLLSTKKGNNILFYGAPGAGKTALAKTLAKHSGRSVYFINEKNDNDEDNTRVRIAGLQACMNIVDPKNSLIVFDEADSILNTIFSSFLGGERVEKSTINSLLESNKKHKIIWITNNSYFIEDSVLRRFSFSLEFKNISQKQRTKIWNKIIEDKGLNAYLSEQEVKTLSNKYQVNTGAIVQAFDDVGHDFKKNKEDALVKMETVLKHHQMLVFNKTDSSSEANAFNYSIEGLNTDTRVDSVLDTLKSFHLSDKKVIRNMNILLSGPPGTGKTEFAKYVAREIDSSLVSKTASQLLDKYIGETEKQIREAFEQAESDNAVLFIDEADSLLYPRSSAERSWEISRTNELLCQMERFRGILICATNFQENLDSASIRRFNIKVKFDYLDTNGKLMFYKKTFGERVLIDSEREESIYNRLSSINNLTPGDFKIVYQKNYYDKNLSHDKLIQDLMLETKHKNSFISKKLGFV